MNSVDLIARENEFKKLNKQLEKKTESLMKEIEEVMQKPDIFSVTPNFKLNLETNIRKHQCSTAKSSPTSDLSTPKNNLCHSKNKKTQKEHMESLNQSKSVKSNIESSSVIPGDNYANQNMYCVCCVKENNSDILEFLYAFVSVNVKDNVLPQSFLKGRVTVESVCKCLSAKVKLMQEQIDILQSTIEKKNKQCEAHLTYIAELESERMSLLNTANNMKSDTAEMKAKYQAIQNRLNEKDRLYKEQRSATDKLTVEIKQFKSKNSTLEARCASQEEVIANLKQQLETVKLSEKEYRTTTRTLSATHESRVAELRRSLAALSGRGAQQSALVANLRSQRALLTAQRALSACTQQYEQMLEDRD